MAVTGAMAPAPHPALENKALLIGDVFIVTWIFYVVEIQHLEKQFKKQLLGAWIVASNTKYKWHGNLVLNNNRSVSLT